MCFLWLLSKASFSLKINLFYTWEEKGREKQALSFQWEEKDGFCGLALLQMRIELGVGNYDGHSDTATTVVLQRKSLLPKISVLELVLLWPLERRRLSLGMPTSFRISRSPSCETDEWCHESDKESRWASLQRDAFLQFTMFHAYFQLLSCLNDLRSCVSITCPCTYPRTREPRSPGCAQQLQPKAKAPCASLWWQHAEPAFRTELVVPHRGDRHCLLAPKKHVSSAARFRGRIVK